jgi:hypothetical protein
MFIVMNSKSLLIQIRFQCIIFVRQTLQIDPMLINRMTAISLDGREVTKTERNNKGNGKEELHGRMESTGKANLLPHCNHTLRLGNIPPRARVKTEHQRRGQRLRTGEALTRQQQKPSAVKVVPERGDECGQ